MTRLEPHPLSSEHMEHLIRFFTDRELYARFQETDLDYTVEFVGLQRRFRVNAFRQRRGPSLALRVLPQSCKTFEELGIPPSFSNVIQEKNGLVVVAGTTGSGKTTTIAAAIEQFNRQHSYHIITVEDPIEFVFQERRSVIEQREVGTHVGTVQEALRSALRQSPDILLVGEVRDPATAQMTLQAAQLGVLVMATLHTRSAAERGQTAAGTLQAVGNVATLAGRVGLGGTLGGAAASAEGVTQYARGFRNGNAEDARIGSVKMGAGAVMAGGAVSLNPVLVAGGGVAYAGAVIYEQRGNIVGGAQRIGRAVADFVAPNSSSAQRNLKAWSLSEPPV
ncbi:MAG: ATPase, T2SS/T4P/T4SS family [Vulcanimicrobiota bacterium]